MAKSIDATIVQLGRAVRRRGSIEFATIALRDGKGQEVVWTKMGMDRAIAEQLRVGEPGRFYFSRAMGTVYGLRWDGEKGHFKTFAANPLALLMSIGMVFMGLATSVLLFPLIAALAGIAGIFLCLDARRARGRFRRDEAMQSPSAAPAAPRVAGRDSTVAFTASSYKAHQPYLTPTQAADHIEASALPYIREELTEEERREMRRACEWRLLAGLMEFPCVPRVRAFVRAPTSGAFFEVPHAYWEQRPNVPNWKLGDVLEPCQVAPGQDASVIGQPVLVSASDAEYLAVHSDPHRLKYGAAN